MWAGCGRALLSAAAANDRLNGLEHDQKIQTHRLMLEVVEIVRKLLAGFCQRRAITVPHLCPSGQPGAHHVAEVVERNLLGKPGSELGPLRPGAHEAHL